MARKSQTPPPTRGSVLWDPQADLEPPTNWCYESINEPELYRVRVGDAVGPVLEDASSNGDIMEAPE